MPAAALSIGSDTFTFISTQWRGKVATDLLARVLPSKEWNFSTFDGHNDYQRHLYALFLRLAGIPKSDIWNRIFVLSDDVSIGQREQYVNDVLNSEIVGFPAQDGGLLMIPSQKVEV